VATLPQGTVPQPALPVEFEILSGTRDLTSNHLGGFSGSDFGQKRVNAGIL
jgi:hypothetical protein